MLFEASLFVLSKTYLAWKMSDYAVHFWPWRFGARDSRGDEGEVSALLHRTGCAYRSYAVTWKQIIALNSQSSVSLPSCLRCPPPSLLFFALLDPIHTFAVSRASARIAQDVRIRAFSGGLKDQDRIFQNIYGEHDKSIQGVMKRGDWYQTDKIVQKVR